MRSRSPAVRPSENFQRSPTSFVTCALTRLQVYKVELMMFIRLNRHLIDEVREWDAAVAHARARVAKNAQKSVAAQEETSNISVGLTV